MALEDAGQWCELCNPLCAVTRTTVLVLLPVMASSPLIVSLLWVLLCPPVQGCPPKAPLALPGRILSFTSTSPAATNLNNANIPVLKPTLGTGSGVLSKLLR